MISSKFRLILLLAGVFILAGCSGEEQLTLAEEGKTDYSILLSTSAPGSVNMAAEDIKTYFEKVTGAAHRILVSSGIPSTPYISFGSSEAAGAEEINVIDIPVNGFRKYQKRELIHSWT